MLEENDREKPQTSSCWLLETGSWVKWTIDLTQQDILYGFMVHGYFHQSHSHYEHTYHEFWTYDCSP